MEAFLHGLILAFGLIIPLGPQNLFVFNEGMRSNSFVSSVPIIITVSLCDTALILLAVLGTSGVILEIPQIKIPLILGGTLFLLYMAYSSFKRVIQIEDASEPKPELSAKNKFLYALGLSILNPHAIIDTIGVIGTSAASYESGNKIKFTIGCILLSWVWFITLTLLGNRLGNFSKVRKLIDIFSGFVMLICAALLIRVIFA
jgi:L-lysine exporter family protein LysE/ArgO